MNYFWYYSRTAAAGYTRKITGDLALTYGKKSIYGYCYGISDGKRFIEKGQVTPFNSRHMALKALKSHLINY